MAETFKVKVGEFEGPMDVLLGLIEDKKLHISQVALATVADDFISYLKKLDQTDKSQIANFILIASTLMLIKSISLLPSMEVSPEEKESMADLERRLRVYQRIKELSLALKGQFGRQIIFAREENRQLNPVFTPSPEISTVGILTAINNLIKNFPRPELIPQVVVKKIISLEEVITDLGRRIQAALRLSFRDFVKDKKDKVNVIVSFLGMLELVKQGIVEVEQSGHFEDIRMETAAPVDIPRYG